MTEEAPSQPAGHQQDTDIANAINAMRPIGQQLAHKMAGKTVTEMAAVMAYILLLFEKTLHDAGKGIGRPRTFDLVGHIADRMIAASILAGAEVPTETRQ